MPCLFSLQLAVQGSFAQPSSVFLLATASLLVLTVFYPSSPSRTTYLNRFQIAEPGLTLHVQFTQFPSWSTVLLPHSTCVTPGNSVKDLLVQAFLRCPTIFLTRCSPYLLFLSFFKTGFAGFWTARLIKRRICTDAMKCASTSDTYYY